MFNTVGDIIINVGVNLSTVGRYHDARWGYHEYRGGGFSAVGENLLLFEYPTVLMISPTVLKLQGMVSPWY